MNERTSEEIKLNIENHATYCCYFYTPLCGTCQLASKMLEVITETFKELPIDKCNLNYAPELGEQLEIESVPCLIIWRDKEIVEKIYAFQSVHYLYNVVKDYWEVKG